MIQIIVGGCIAAAILIAVVVWYLSKKRGVSVKEQVDEIVDTIATQPPSSQKPSESLIQEAFDGLLKVNIFIRTKAVPNDVLELVEKQIDDLRFATPQMIEKIPDHDLTYELKRICEEHMFNQLKEFFDMDSANINKYMAELIERLKDIGEHITRARNIVENNEVAEMKMIAGFLETKYSQGYDQG